MSELEKLENEIKKGLLEYAIKEEAYNKGLNDTWELISKVFSLNRTERKKAFGCEEIRTVVDCFNVKEALAKLEAYEKANEINVGDVVIISNHEFLITSVSNNYVNLIDSEGNTCSTKLPCKKTGKHIDIQKILEQIGE